MAAWRYEISLLMLKYFSTLEEKFLRSHVISSISVGNVCKIWTSPIYKYISRIKD